MNGSLARYVEAGTMTENSPAEDNRNALRQLHQQLRREHEDSRSMYPPSNGPMVPRQFEIEADVRYNGIVERRMAIITIGKPPIDAPETVVTERLEGVAVMNILSMIPCDPSESEPAGDVAGAAVPSELTGTDSDNSSADEEVDEEVDSNSDTSDESTGSAEPTHMNDVVVTFADLPDLSFKMPDLLVWLRVDPEAFAQLRGEYPHLEFEDLTQFVSWVNAGLDMMNAPDFTPYVRDDETGSSSSGGEFVASFAPPAGAEESAETQGILSMPVLGPLGGWPRRAGVSSESESSDRRYLEYSDQSEENRSYMEYSDRSEESSVPIFPEDILDGLQDEPEASVAEINLDELP